MSGTYLEITGNVTSPTPSKDGRVIVIPHVCNNIGLFGAGVALSIAKVWPHVQEKYFLFTKKFPGPKQEVLLGMVQFVVAEKTDSRTILIANMFAQNGVRGKGNSMPLQYPALTRAMADVVHTCSQAFEKEGFEIHCPKFGTGLAGGTWKKIKPFINLLWIDSGIDVTIYNFGG